MVRHEGYSSNEFEIIPDVLSSESRWTCLIGNGLVWSFTNNVLSLTMISCGTIKLRVRLWDKRINESEGMDLRTVIRNVINE